MKGLILVLLLLVTSTVIKGQIAGSSATTAFAGFGSYSKSFVDVFSGTANPAAFAKLETASLGVTAERKFLLQELQQLKAVIALPSTFGAFALQANYAGFSGLNTSQLGIGYARDVAATLSAGVNFNYQSLRIMGYGSEGSVNIEGGVIFHPSKKFHAGITFYKSLQNEVGKLGSELATLTFGGGIGFEASDKLFVTGSFTKQPSFPLLAKAGVQYNLHERVLLRAGVETSTTTAFAGVGIKLGNSRIDVYTSYHQYLGVTPGIQLLFNGKKTVKE